VGNDEIGQVFLGGELVAETEAVVEKAKDQNELPIIDRLLLKNDFEITIMISDRFHLAPDRFPGFVLNSGLGLDDRKAGVKGRLVFQADTKLAGQNDRISSERELIGRFAFRA